MWQAVWLAMQRSGVADRNVYAGRMPTLRWAQISLDARQSKCEFVLLIFEIRITQSAFRISSFQIQIPQSTIRK